MLVVKTYRIQKFKTLAPKIFKQIDFPEGYTRFNLWIFISLAYKRYPESKNIPGFKGHSWEEILLLAKGRTWMDTPDFAVVLHFPYLTPTKGIKTFPFQKTEIKIKLQP